MISNTSNSPTSSLVHEVAEKYHVTAHNDFAQVELAQKGLPVSAFFDMLRITGLNRTEMSGLLDVSFKTIQRYEKEGKKLNALNSEQLLRMIELYRKGEEVFGELDSFQRWLRKPVHGLGEHVPLSLMNTPGGIGLIYEELQRIEYGALA